MNSGMEPRYVSQMAFDEAEECFRNVQKLQAVLCQDGLTLAEKRNIKDQIDVLLRKRNSILGAADV